MKSLWLIFLLYAIVANCSSKSVLNLESSEPRDGATGVKIDTSITLKFNSILNAGSLAVQSENGTCSGSIQLSSDSFANCLTINLKTESNPSIVATPVNALSYSSQYAVKITTAIKNADDKSVSTEKTLTFNTETGMVILVPKGIAE